MNAEIGKTICSHMAVISVLNIHEKWKSRIDDERVKKNRKIPSCGHVIL